MTTMASAIQAFVASVERPVTSDEIRRHIDSEYPGQWQRTTLQMHLYGCVANNPKAYIHHPHAKKFLYKNNDGTFELYSQERHGPNEWVPQEGEEAVELVELAESSITLERDMEDYLVRSLDSIETGLRLVGRQVTTDVGRVDILAQDSNGCPVIIEVKVGEAKDSAIGQIARYLGWYQSTKKKGARAILIAAEFPDGVRYAASAIPNCSLLAYRIQFSFERITA